MGETFRVVPAVLVRSQVLNNNLGACYLPAEEITDNWAEEWNCVPVVTTDHPTVRGQAVSARTPDILNSFGAGFIFNAKTDQKGDERRLIAEVWLKQSRANDIAELAVIMSKLDAGEPVELSTGFMAMGEEVTGVYNGENYNIVLHPRGADHLAIFTEKTGACSVEDGCGLGVNKAVGNSTTGGEMADNAAPPDVRQDGERESESWMIKVAKFFGLRSSPAANAESDEDRRALIWSGLNAQYGGAGKYCYIESLFSEDGYVVFEIYNENLGSSSGLMRADFEISEENVVTFSEPVAVRRRTVYEPVANVAAENTSRGETGGEMNRETHLAALASAGPLDRASLERLNDCQLKALFESSTAGIQAATTPAPAAAAANAAPAPATTTPAPAAVADAGNAAIEALTATVAGLAGQLTALQNSLNTVQEVARPAVEERERIREGLIAELTGNQMVLAVHTKEEISAMGIDALQKVKALVTRTSFTGRGGPRATNAAPEPAFMEPVPYWQQPSNSGAAGTRPAEA